jgi:hypothetical protein
VASRFACSARDDLRGLLIGRLCGLCAPVLYDRFVESSAPYDAFVTEMKSGGLIRLLHEKPVLLRLVACVTRQWLTTTREFLVRFDEDLKRIRHDLLHRDADAEVAHVWSWTTAHALSTSPGICDSMRRGSRSLCG